MSLHKSLKAATGRGHRSVLKRIERLEVLARAGRWSPAQSVFGLPKVKTVKVKIKKAKAVEAAPVAEAAPATPVAPEAPKAQKPSQPKT